MGKLTNFWIVCTASLIVLLLTGCADSQLGTGNKSSLTAFLYTDTGVQVESGDSPVVQFPLHLEFHLPRFPSKAHMVSVNWTRRHWPNPSRTSWNTLTTLPPSTSFPPIICARPAASVTWISYASYLESM